jgi:hypothetical protein
MVPLSIRRQSSTPDVAIFFLSVPKTVIWALVTTMMPPPVLLKTFWVLVTSSVEHGCGLTCGFDATGCAGMGMGPDLETRAKTAPVNCRFICHRGFPKSWETDLSHHPSQHFWALGSLTGTYHHHLDHPPVSQHDTGI